MENNLEYGIAFGASLGAAAGFIYSGFSLNFINLVIFITAGLIAGIVISQIVGKNG